MRAFFWKLCVIVAVVGMIAVNALANILPINGVNTGVVSDSYPIYFVPAGYVFSIWGLIYLALIAFAIAQFVSDSAQSAVARVRPLFVLSCVANGVWIFCWHYYQLALSVAVMLVLLVTLIVIYRRLARDVGAHPSVLVRFTVTAPISLYLGWICVATVANISAFLWNLGWHGSPLDGPTWAGIMMLVAGAIIAALALLHSDRVPCGVLVWALVGIVVKFPDQTLMRVVGLFVCGAMLAVMVLISVRSRRLLERSDA